MLLRQSQFQALFFLLFYRGSFLEASGLRRTRSLYNFLETVTCAIDKTPKFLSGDYGCYCGLNKRGAPVDDVDRCCATHHYCYSMLTETQICNERNLYLDSYDWECLSSGSVQDASFAPFLSALQTIFGGSSTRTARDIRTASFPVCKSASSQCGMSLCFCDVQASLCFANCSTPVESADCPYP